MVLFYGGNLVLEGHMSAGALVSFMLYQQSLASAFQVSTASISFRLFLFATAQSASLAAVQSVSLFMYNIVMPLLKKPAWTPL